MVAQGMGRRALQPCFDNVRGAMAGYSPADISPSWKNREAFLQELSSCMSLDEEVEPGSWEEVLSDVEQFLQFWKLYYCSISSDA